MKFFGPCIDVSPTAIEQCRQLFSSDTSKSFRLFDELNGEKTDLNISPDVIYHLTEDVVFKNYVRNLFEASRRDVILYASDTDDNSDHDSAHVKHRKFTKWISHHLPGWKLKEHIPNKYPYQGDYTKGSFADFFI